MKFLVTWNIPHDKWVPMLKIFTSLSPEERADAGDGVELVGRWHDLVARTGVAVFEARDIKAVQLYALRWNPHMDLTIAPVIEDEEVASVAGAWLASSP